MWWCSDSGWFERILFTCSLQPCKFRYRNYVYWPWKYLGTERYKDLEATILFPTLTSLWLSELCSVVSFLAIQVFVSESEPRTEIYLLGIWWKESVFSPFNVKFSRKWSKTESICQFLFEAYVITWPTCSTVSRAGHTEVRPLYVSSHGHTAGHGHGQGLHVHLGTTSVPDVLQQCCLI